jgi:isopenicillin-N N-acyltransferase-like protein
MTAAEALQGTLPVIDVAGSHREIGRGIGEALRDGLRAVAEAHRAGVERAIGWERALAIARGLIPATAAALPRCVDELRGMAEGSGVPFETLFSMNALQETRFLAGRDGASPTPDEEDEGCTSLAVSGQATADGHVLLAHNEDAGTIRHALPYVVRARPDGRPAFAGFAYSGLLLYQGMNDRGIGSVGNALYFTDIRPGTPKLLAYRDVLDAEFLEDAIRRTRKPTRANGNNHLLANAHGEIYDVEVSGGDSALLSSGDMLAHTNHAVDPRMRALEWGRPFDRLRATPAQLGDAVAARRASAGTCAGRDHGRHAIRYSERPQQLPEERLQASRPSPQPGRHDGRLGRHRPDGRRDPRPARPTVPDADDDGGAGRIGGESLGCRYSTTCWRPTSVTRRSSRLATCRPRHGCASRS